ncbi:MAG: type II toxin-antitoxin system VapC family toxin [Mycobacteriales bacterium]
MIYIDSCALVKLVRAEEHSTAIAQYVSAATAAMISSELTRTEVHRALWRNQEDPTVHAAAEKLLRPVATLPIGPAVDSAAELPHQHLRSLDALHLATALKLGAAVSAFITYDQRLAQAARESG